MNRFGSQLGHGIERITSSALGPRQTAVIRIGFAATWLVFLLRELPNRHELYGPDSPWSWDMAQQLIAENDAFTALMWSDGRIWFETVYALAVLSSALLMLGWRTRTMSVIFMIGVLSLQNRSIFMGDGGDNVIHLMATYLVFTRCGQVWSLDARRGARARARAASVEQGETPVAQGKAAEPPVDRVGPVLWWVLGLGLCVVTLMGELSGGWSLVFWGLWLAHGLWWAVGRRAPDGEAHKLLDVVVKLAHNAALLVIMVEACLIYATAGWYKIQGSRWQDGTAIYYPLRLDYFSPWPALSDLLASHGLMVMLVTYGTVAVQVAFPFTLFNRRVKNVLLAAMICEHAVIAVVLGLPFFSLAMIAADAVFLPTSFLRRVGEWTTRARRALFSRVSRFSWFSRGGTVPGQRGADEEPAPESTEHARVGFPS
ncbi:HTTM domain-containing protein [Streptomyces sp. NPDC058257]|uniref:HTTM domain-containing protein n=1 Tax=Streptomyces sp. NPDC058257 TaxID=3346409 RepID=UPI0036E8F226